MGESTKKKISDKLKGRPSPLAGRPISEEHRLKLVGKEPWNKGLTKEDNTSLQSTSSKLKGRKFTKLQKDRMSQSRKDLFESGYKPTWYNNGEVEIQLDTSNDFTVPEGFVLGRLYTVYVTKDGVSKKINELDLHEYLSKGWLRGRDSISNENVKKSRQMFTWHYEGLDFVNAAELAKYLNDRGYPKIVGCTITDLYNRGFDKSPTYKSLEGKITRTKVNHED